MFFMRMINKTKTGFTPRFILLYNLIMYAIIIDKKEKLYDIETVIDPYYWVDCVEQIKQELHENIYDVKALSNPDENRNENSKNLIINELEAKGYRKAFLSNLITLKIAQIRDLKANKKRR